MTSRMLKLSLRTMPRTVRASDGEAIRVIAEDQIAAGEVSATRQSLGILRHGLRKRTLANTDALRAMPWASALWRLALPISAVQFTILFAVSGIVGGPDGSIAWPGKWIALVLLLSALAFVAAAIRERRLLAASSGSILLLFCMETWGSGGSMRGGTSHTPDVAFQVSGIMYSPVVLILIPTTVLLVAAACTKPAPGRWGMRSIAGWGLLPAAILAAVQVAGPVAAPATNGFALALLGVGGFLVLVAYGKLRTDPSALLSAALLLFSQGALMGVALTFAVMNRSLFAQLPWPVVIPLFFVLLFLPCICAIGMARHVFPPYKPRDQDGD